MPSNVIQSAGGIIYHTQDEEPKYLLIKRMALSRKIERVAPKGKIQKGEKIEETVMREISEEVGIPLNQIKLKQQIGTTHLRNTSNIRGHVNKDVTYFLVEYKGNPENVEVALVEGYLGIYKRATIQEVLGLVYYQDIRELYRQAHLSLQAKNKKQEIMKDFMNSL